MSNESSKPPALGAELPSTLLRERVPRRREEGKTEILKLTPNVASTGSEASGWHLIVIDGEDFGDRHTVTGDSTTIGRDPACDVQIRDTGVSRVHCRIRRTEAGFVLQDAGSTNGSFVNGKRVETHLLEEGDVFRVARTSIKFLSASSVETRYHTEFFHRSILDELTGVFNRRYLFDILVNEILRAARHKHSLCLALIDVDHFKAVNDRYGHVVGDLVLREVADRIRSVVRRTDVIARYGGEEFALVAPETPLGGGVTLANNVRQAIAATPFLCGGLRIDVRVSAGVADFEDYRREVTRGGSHTTDSWLPAVPELLIECADRKLYAAKAAGRNRVV